MKSAFTSFSHLAIKGLRTPDPCSCVPCEEHEAPHSLHMSSDMGQHYIVWKSINSIWSWITFMFSNIFYITIIAFVVVDLSSVFLPPCFHLFHRLYSDYCKAHQVWQKWEAVLITRCLHAAAWQHPEFPGSSRLQISSPLQRHHRIPTDPSSERPG